MKVRGTIRSTQHVTSRLAGGAVAVIFGVFVAFTGTSSAFRIVGAYSVNSPGILAPAPNGAMWFGDIVYPTGTAAVGITRIDADGTQKSFALEKPDAANMSEHPPIAAGPHGFVWTAAYRAARHGNATIYRVAQSGTFRAFNLAKFRSIRSLVAGPGGRIWFFGENPHRIGMITSTGQVSFLRFKGANHLLSMVRGPKSTMWAMSSAQIFEISSSGHVRKFAAPANTSGDIALGGDGNVWVTAGASLMRITPAGSRKYVPIFNQGTSQIPRYAVGIARAANGNVAYEAATATEYPSEGGRVEQPSFGVIDSNDAVTETSPSPALFPSGPTDFDIWWREGVDAPPLMSPGIQQVTTATDGTYWISGVNTLWKMDAGK